MTDILILGYYGFKNSGDDALLLSIIRQLKELKNDVELCVLSANPEETSRIYGIKSVKRDNPFALIKAISSCRLLLVGGGTLIQDGTSTKSLLYYLYVIKIAQLLGKKVMLYANGIGPLKEENYGITAKILNKADVITLRDEMSIEELKKIGVTKPEIKLCADSAFGLEIPRGIDAKQILKKHGIVDEKYFCVSVRDNKYLAADFCKNIAAACDYIYEKYNFYPVFLPFQKSRDTKITEEIISYVKSPSAVLDTEGNMDELLGVVSGAELCIGMRLHSLIYSAVCNTPVIGLVYDPKVKGFMEYIGQGRYVNVQTLTAGELIPLCDDCIKNREQIRAELTKACGKMKEKALLSAEIAINLLKK